MARARQIQEQFVLGDLREALRVLAPGLPSIIDGIELRAGYPELFGALWPGHGLTAGRDLRFGSGATETVLTRGLAFFLSPQDSGPVGEHRTATFLAALLEAAQLDETPAIQFSPGSLIVAAESVGRSRLSRSRRIDLFISWISPAGTKACVAVEAKLDAPDQPGQLRAYAEHCRQQVGLDGHHWCVYLTRTGRPVPGRLRESWFSASWLGLLRRWERGLAADQLAVDDDDFVRFRRDLWATACRS